jgi:hypothetical protein
VSTQHVHGAGSCVCHPHNCSWRLLHSHPCKFMR